MPSQAPSRPAAAVVWRERLEYLRVQEAICSDPVQGFTLRKQIEDAEAALARLSAAPNNPDATRDAERPGMHPHAERGDESGARAGETAAHGHESGALRAGGHTPSPLVGEGRGGGSDRPQPRVDLNHLPAGAEHFLGRGPELAALDAAWTPGSGIAVVEVIAPGGTGKTVLVKRWLDAQRPAGNGAGWGGAREVYGWSFYSQGTGDDRQASEDQFLAAAIARFGVAIEASANPADKGQALADRLCTARTLLILDGCEPLQYPPGPCAGELRAPGLKTLLTQLAAAGHPGLCIVTSREWLADLSEWVRTATHPRGAVLRLDLGNLSATDGARLLHARGATRAGAAAIAADDPELQAASREVGGHALTLALLGRYLARARGGDILQRDAVDPARADRDARGHAARVIAAYETWFAREGQTGSVPGARALAALRLLGLFDRPATRALLDALREPPPIPGLTEALFEPTPARPARGLLGWLRTRKALARPGAQPIAEPDWTLTLKALEDCGLVQPDPRGGALDAHPLVREHLAAALAARDPAAWREGHRRLYVRLKGSVPRHLCRRCRRPRRGRAHRHPRRHATAPRRLRPLPRPSLPRPRRARRGPPPDRRLPIRPPPPGVGRRRARRRRLARRARAPRRPARYHTRSGTSRP